MVLAACAMVALRSQKTNGRYVARLTGALIAPVIGNLIITATGNRTLATVGCYIYFIGMDIVMSALLRFTLEYCNIKWHSRNIYILLYTLLGIDVLQFLCNPFFGNAFSTDAVMVDGFAYYRVIPHAGQVYHRLLDYSIFLSVLLIFLIKALRASRYNTERYSVILITMVCTGIFQTFYIFSRTPVDLSMIGYGVFGILVFYFTLYYRPLRLLDRMLVNVVSDMPEALFFFDEGGSCIWANHAGVDMTHITNDNYEQASDRLRQLFGDVIQTEEEGPVQCKACSGDEEKSYVLLRRPLTDSRNRLAGFFLTIRDNTSEQLKLEKRTYEAIHDALTGVYNRTGYYQITPDLDLNTTCMFLIDIDDFKSINDTYGHKAGDKVLQKAAQLTKRYFRAEDYIFRVGGDEFVVLMVRAREDQRNLAGKKVEHINNMMNDGNDDIPNASLSVGIAYGIHAADFKELFEQADHALYATKQKGKNGYSFWEKGM